MEEINQEIGLNAILRRDSAVPVHDSGDLEKDLEPTATHA
jgi:hypothetical protein